jgi:predicted esterase
MYKKIITLLCLLTGLGVLQSNAAEKGLFDKEITFGEGTRKISCLIPNDYDSTIPNKLLVCLHGAGDNSTNYSSALKEQLDWEGLAENCLYVFPDGGDDRARDFYAPAGDEAIIDSTIAWMSREYNINADSIFLQGFSLGGRSALKYGLDNYDKIVGLMLHTPAMQSPLDVNNIEGYSLNFAYENANKIPISITVGTKDYGFKKTVAMLADTLIENNGKLIYVPIPDFPHSIPPMNLNSGLFQFLVEGAIDDKKPILHKIIVDDRVYTNKTTLKFRVRNLSKETISSYSINYCIDEGEVITKSFENLQITSNAYVDLEVEIDELTNGYHEVSGYISSIDGESVEEMEIFNNQLSWWNSLLESEILPFADNFSEKNEFINNWTIQASGNYFSWFVENVGNGNQGSMFMFNNLLAYTNWGLIEKLYSKKINFANAEKPAVSFDIAYNYTIYDETVLQNTTAFMDTLEIVISNDNWKTQKSIFKKWGDSLITFDAPLLNPMQQEVFLSAPEPKDWERLTIEFDKKDVTDSTLIRFDYISGSGSVIFLDNFIAHDLEMISVEDESVHNINLYPNPVTNNNSINISFENKAASIVDIELVDVSGKKISDLYSQYTNSGMNELTLQLPQLNSGVYFVKINNGKKISFEKVIIK